MVAACGLVWLTLLGGIPGSGAQEPATDDPLTSEQRDWLETHGPIRFAPRPDYPPFSMVGADGETVGLELDLMNRISRNLGIEFEVVHAEDLADAEERLRRGRVDVVAPVTRTAEREAYLDFLDPHVQVSLLLYTASDAEFQNVSALAGRPVAAVEDAPSTMRFAEAHPDIAVVPVSDVAEGFDRLGRGQVAAVLAMNTAAGHHLQETGQTGFTAIDTPVETLKMHWAVSKDVPMLRDILERGMDSIAPGERQRIFAFWTGDDISVPAEEADGDALSPLARDIIVVASIVTVLAIAWGVALRRQVRAQTEDLRHSRDALRRHKERLEDTVQARTRELEETAEDLRRSNRELERFAYVASHDLQEPLRMVRSYLDLLDRRYSDRLDTDGEEFLAYARDGAERMSVLIQDLLELSRIGTRPVRDEKVQLEKVVDDALHDLGRRIAETDAVVVKGPLPAVRGDPNRLRQLLQNLISNAIKFQQQGARPEVRILAAPSGDGMVGVMVADDGIGMAPEKTEEIFEPFRRLHHRSEYPGTGIGLAICRRIVEAHGGTIHAESDGPGTGTRFVFTLPLAEDVPSEGLKEKMADVVGRRAERPLDERLEEDLEELREAVSASADR